MDGAAEAVPQVGDISGRAIGQCALGVVPDKFVRVEFRGVSRKAMDPEPFVLVEKLTDDDAPVDRAAVPQEHDRPAQMPQEMAQETDDLHAGDVGCVETEVKSKTRARGGHGDGGDGGNSISPIAVSEDGGLADRRPGLADVRNEEEPAFVEEDEMGPKSLGFFLYSATRISSSGRWPPRPFAWPGAPVFATSIPNSASPATHGPGGSGSRNAARSVWICAAGSTVGSCILPPEDLVLATVTACVSGTATVAVDARASAWAGEPLCLPGGSSVSSAPQSLWRSSGSRPPTDTSCQTAARQRHGVFVLRAVEGFHGVACPIG